MPAIKPSKASVSNSISFFFFVAAIVLCFVCDGAIRQHNQAAYRNQIALIFP